MNADGRFCCGYCLSGFHWHAILMVKTKRVDNAITYLETGDVDDKSKQLIASYLDRKLD